MLGLAGSAYTFGLRHAFDADHISAIDNTTRKLLQEGKKPMGVGFFFFARTLDGCIPDLAGVGSGYQVRRPGSDRFQWSTEADWWRHWHGSLGRVPDPYWHPESARSARYREGLPAHAPREFDQAALTAELNTGGFMTRLFGRFFKLIGSSLAHVPHRLSLWAWF